MMISRAKIARQSLVVALVTEACAGHTVSDLEAHVASKGVPEGFIAVAVRHVRANSSLATVTDKEFMAAIAEARPDLAQVLDNPAGRAWVEMVAWRIGGALVGGAIGRLFRRG